MTYYSKFRTTFINEMKNNGLLLTDSDNILIANNHDKYLKLELHQEYFGSNNRTTIPKLTIILGDYHKALNDNIITYKNIDKYNKTEGKSFQLYFNPNNNFVNQQFDNNL